jgi:DNA-directed RNA polymerase specialized sigma24 family protein
LNQGRIILCAFAPLREPMPSIPSVPAKPEERISRRGAEKPKKFLAALAVKSLLGSKDPDASTNRLAFGNGSRKLSSTNDDDSNVIQDALPRARKFRRDAVEVVLRAYYPLVCRVALALCGRTSNGREVVGIVMRQSLNAIPSWKDEAVAANWFLHHTILKSRELAGEMPDASEDCLVLTLKTPSAEHIAFVKALRNLPAQQREAFLLLRGERLEPRRAAVAMDCSTGAAANHLIAATRTLSAIAANTFDARVAELVRVYASLTPPAELILGDVNRLGRKLRRRGIARLIRQTILLAILAVIAWTIWKLSKMIIV